MKIIYNQEKLKRILNDLHILTGVSLSFIDFNGTEKVKAVFNNDFCSNLQKSSVYKQKCENCDVQVVEKCKQSRCFESHLCHQNLYDAAFPIEKDGVLVGYILMGRIRIEGGDPNGEVTSDSELLRLFNRVPLFSDSKIDALKTLLPEILFANAIALKNDSVLDGIFEYIDQNISRNISVEDLCNRFFLSRNALYKHFSKGLGCTVNQYITEQRMKKAKALLTDTELTVEAVARMVGFGNCAYFCRAFKQNINKTPSEYRTASR